ncbi:hypothetical protein [Sinorhizobium meliloti]|nr:hypothetical protein [Sinorhizobium meliloti]
MDIAIYFGIAIGFSSSVGFWKSVSWPIYLGEMIGAEAVKRGIIR